MSDKLKVLDDFVDQIPALKKIYIDSVEENEQLSQANQKIQLQRDIAQTSAMKENEENSKLKKLVQELELNYKRVVEENTELTDGNLKLTLKNKTLQEENATLKTDKTQLAFRLNEVEQSSEQAKKQSREEVTSLTLEKNSLKERVESLEITISNEIQKSKEKDEKNEKFERYLSEAQILEKNTLVVCQKLNEKYLELINEKNELADKFTHLEKENSAKQKRIDELEKSEPNVDKEACEEPQPKRAKCIFGNNNDVDIDSQNESGAESDTVNDGESFGTESEQEYEAEQIRSEERKKALIYYQRQLDEQNKLFKNEIRKTKKKQWCSVCYKEGLFTTG